MDGNTSLVTHVVNFFALGFFDLITYFIALDKYNFQLSSDIEIDNTYNKYLANKYCVYPMCVYQKESYSDINKEIINYGWFHKKFSYDD